MFLTNKHLDRRTFLRGMGAGMSATVALPLLDAMIPTRALLAAMRPTQRLAFVYFPHGAVMNEWIDDGRRQPLDFARDGLADGRRGTADGQTADYEATDTDLGSGSLHGGRPGRVLEPLSPFANRLTIVSGVENRHAYGPVHAITPGTWLSGLSPREKSDGTNGATADQLAADYLSGDTPLSSLALAVEEPKQIGAGIWEGEFDQSLSTTLSFRRAGLPVPMDSSPREVFDRLFRDGARCQVPRAKGLVPGAECRVLAARCSSVLDRVADDAARLRTKLGPADRMALGDYFDAVRGIERRVERVPASDDIEQQFVERLALMFDLTALAFRADITRVASMMMAAEASSMTYSHIGVPESFHLISHHQNDPENLEKLVRIQAFHTRMFANFVRTLAELPDGDASLLDRSTVLFGSNMSDSHAHDHFPLPLALVGGGCGSLPGFRHAQLPDRTPMPNVLLTVLRRAGVTESGELVKS